MRYGKLSEPEMVPGSTKAGVELLRPRWRFSPELAAQNLAGGTCSNFGRTSSLSNQDDRWSAPAVITWRTQAMPEDEEVVVSPVFSWAGVYIDRTAAICTY